MVSLLSDRPRMASFERAARERALREQTWDHRIAQYEELFEKVAGRGGGARLSA